MKILWKLKTEPKFRGIFKVESNENEEVYDKISNKEISVGGLKLDMGAIAGLFSGLPWKELNKVFRDIYDESGDSGNKDRETDSNSSTEAVESLSQKKLHHSEALKKLEDAGIQVVASGGSNYVTSDRKLERGTSLEKIRKTTIQGIIALKKHISGEFVITGGSETWTHSALGGHHQGKKVDVRKTQEIANFIKENTTENENIDPMTAPDKTEYKFKKDGYKYVILSENNPQHFDIKVKKI